jgi:chromate transporter
MTGPPAPRPATLASRLGELALLFLKLGTISFGGPAAHLAMMEDEIVERRRWLTREQFVDLLGATNLIPGPNSTEMAIHIGRQRAGVPGLLVAGACFILPAFLIVAIIAHLYRAYGTLPQFDAVLYGIKPVVVAVIAQALWRLARSVLTTWPKAVLALGAVAAVLLGVHELVVLAGAGVLMAFARAPRPHAALLPFAPLGVAPALAAAPFSTTSLFLFFLKVGSVLFGSGYVLLAFLRADLVERWHWLTEAQLLDAVAVGQVTPGPVFTTATFIGYILDGPRGAGVATVGIFLPAFFFVAISGPLVPLLRTSRTAGAVLDGVNIASLALMGVVSVQLAQSSLTDAPRILIAAGSYALLTRWKANSAWLVIGGGIAGALLSLAGLHTR